MNVFIVDALHQYGYPALWLIIFVAAAGAPISGNLLLYAAGAFAAFGDFNLFVLFLVGTSAAIMGDSLGYLIGWKVGPPLFAWLEKRRRLRFFAPQAIARGRAYFRRRAGWAVFFTRFLIVVLGGPINLLAGAERYSYRKFLCWDVSGQILGALIPLGIGYTFAASWDEASNIFGAVSTFLLLSLVATFISVLFLRKLRARREAQALETQAPASEPAKPTILILISRSGGGHLNLAQALRDTLEARYTVSIVDPQSRMVERFYTWVSRHWTGFLGWQARWTDNEVAAWWLQNALALLGYRRFLAVMEKARPQLVITTHAMVSYVAARVNENSARRVPLVFQLTDLERVHATWFTEKHADAYLAPTREIFAQALEAGIAKERLYLTGRPLRRQFGEIEQSSQARAETLGELGLDPAMLTLFLQGGAQGSASADRLIQHVLSADLPIQIILAAGNNRLMAARYAGQERIRVLPFTEQIAPYMAAADVIAGKAGASFISEAFRLEKPFLVTAVIPAQEGPGLDFIRRYNLGWICLSTREQQELLTALVSSPQLLASKMDDIRAYNAWNMQANQEIGAVIDSLLLAGPEMAQ